MDVSGSMTDDQKEIVRIESFWIDTWLKSQYDGIERRYVVHDAVAHEVDEDTFYRIRESGGTRISSAYTKTKAIIDRDFPPSDWNIYVFQFSDGDNWAKTIRTASGRCAKTCSRSAICSATARSKAPTGAATSSASSASSATSTRTWCSRKSKARKGSTTRSRRSSARGGELRPVTSLI